MIPRMRADEAERDRASSRGNHRRDDNGNTGHDLRNDAENDCPAQNNWFVNSRIYQRAYMFYL